MHDGRRGLSRCEVPDHELDRPSRHPTVGIDEVCSDPDTLELGPDHPLGRACVGHLENIRTVVSTLAEEAGLREPEVFARSWHILMKGSIVSAAEGDAGAAKRAQAMARRLIEHHR